MRAGSSGVPSATRVAGVVWVGGDGKVRQVGGAVEVVTRSGVGGGKRDGEKTVLDWSFLLDGFHPGTGECGITPRQKQMWKREQTHS